MILFLIKFVIWIAFWKFENNIFKTIPLEHQLQGDYKPQVQGRGTLNNTHK